jgi:anti-sigma B factor antagonist
MPPPMLITERVVGDVSILDLKGRFLDSPDEVFRSTMNRLINEGRRKVVLNLAEVTYIDSSGLGMLVSRYIRLTKIDGQLKLCGMSHRSSHVMIITNLLSVFKSYDTEQLALLSFTESGNNETKPPT